MGDNQGANYIKSQTFMIIAWYLYGNYWEGKGNILVDHIIFAIESGSPYSSLELQYFGQRRRGSREELL